MAELTNSTVETPALRSLSHTQPGARMRANASHMHLEGALDSAIDEHAAVHGRVLLVRAAVASNVLRMADVRLLVCNLQSS